MQPTPDSPVNQLLDDLLVHMRAVLGDRLASLYLYGSLVTGDFDLEISDIDLLAAISNDLDEAEFSALDQIQGDIIASHQGWENRLEIAYLSLHALKTFKTQTSPIAIISPGEPFHIKDAGKDWLMNWYMVREKGVTLFGPPPQAIIDPTSKAEFVQAVKEHMGAWREWIKEAPKYRRYQAYAILTMCRGLYTYQNGEQVSKRQAALWAQKELPEWATLIQNALLWRQGWREENVDDDAIVIETRRFVNFIIDRIYRW